MKFNIVVAILYTLKCTKFNVFHYAWNRILKIFLIYVQISTRRQNIFARDQVVWWSIQRTGASCRLSSKMVSDWPIGKNQHRLDAFFLSKIGWLVKKWRFSTTIMNPSIRENNFFMWFLPFGIRLKKYTIYDLQMEVNDTYLFK